MADNTNATIDELQIEISVNSLKAQANIDLLAESLKEVGSSGSELKKVAKGLIDLGNASAQSATKARKTAEATAKTSEKIKELGKNAKHATGWLGNLFASFKRIAMYRAMRSVIKGITQALGEGIQNLVEWDAAFGNNTSGALATMTEIKSLSLQIKNSLGAMAMPLIQAVLPALRLVAKGLMFIVNIVNQVVRAFQGYSDYMKAVYTETDYLGDSLNNASGKAKELKRVLFGFDELNVLPSKDGYGGTGGTGVLGNLDDYFDPTPINSKLQDVANKIKELFGPLFTKKFWEDIWTDIDTYLFTPIGTALSFIWGYLDAYIINPVGGFVEALTQSLGYIGEIVEVLFTPSRWSEIPTLLEEFPGKIKKTWTDYFSTVSKGIDNLNKKEISPKTKLDAPTNINDALKNTQDKLDEKSLILPSAIKNPTNGKTVLTATQSKVADYAAITFKSSLKSVSNTKSTRNAAQNTVNALDSVTFKSKLKAISNNKAVRNESQQTVNGLPAIGYKAKVNSILGKKDDSSWSTLWGNWNSAKSWLSTGSLPFKTSTTSIVGKKGDSDTSTLWGNWNTAKAWLSTGSLMFKTGLAFTGLADSLEWVWTKLQTSLNKNPLEYTAKITSGSTSGNTFQGKTEIFATPKASGGTVDTGSLFIAGEAGPEIVGNMNGRTGVMNMAQMRDAVADGNIAVVNALYALINTVNGKNFDIYMDSAKVGQSVSNYQNNQMRRGVAY